MICWFLLVNRTTKKFDFWVNFGFGRDVVCQGALLADWFIVSFDFTGKKLNQYVSQKTNFLCFGDEPADGRGVSGKEDEGNKLLQTDVCL